MAIPVSPDLGPRAPPADRRVRAAGCLPPSLATAIVIGACGGARPCGARTEDSIWQLPDGSVLEVASERCPAGHPLLPHGTLVGWSPCDYTSGLHGHRTYTCRFLVDGAECGLVLSFEPCRDPSAGPSSWV